MAAALRYLIGLLAATSALVTFPVAACDSIDAEPIFAPAPIIFVGKLTNYEVFRSVSGEPVVAVLTYGVQEPLKGEIGDTVRLSWPGAPWGEGIPPEVQAPSSEIVGATLNPSEGRKLAQYGLFTGGCGDRYSIRATQHNVEAIKNWIVDGEVSELETQPLGSKHTIDLAARDRTYWNWLTVAKSIAAIGGLVALLLWYRRRRRKAT